MEAIQTKSNVCPRCNGKGEFKCFAHVKAGICFACWGTCVDLAGEIREAQRAVADARGRWVRMSRRLRRCAPGSVEAGACAQALDNIEVEGKRLARFVDRLIKDREALAAKHRSP